MRTVHREHVSRNEAVRNPVVESPIDLRTQAQLRQDQQVSELLVSINQKLASFSIRSDKNGRLGGRALVRHFDQFVGDAVLALNKQQVGFLPSWKQLLYNGDCS